MHAQPSAKDVVKVAAGLGIQLGLEAAALYRDAIIEQLAAIDELLSFRLSEQAPPLSYPIRDTGYRPSAEEDPYRVWLWKCSIGGDTEGLLAGKRVSFKDHIAVAGIPETFGAEPLEGFIPDFDATVVNRVLAAGGRVIGKNSMDGLTGGRASGAVGGDYPPPINPHDATRITGGSSSGSAAAVAVGEVDIAFGGDQGGSAHVPAALCGVIGVKPTFGLVSHMGVAFGAEPSLDHVGPIARYVEDAAAALEAVAGHDDFDPRQTKEIPDCLDVMTSLKRGVSGLRIGILDEGFATPIDEEVRESVLSALDVLHGLGAEIKRVSVEAHEFCAPAFLALSIFGSSAIQKTGIMGFGSATFYPSSLIVAFNKMWASSLERMSPRTIVGYLTAEFSRRSDFGAAYAKAQNLRSTFAHAYDRALSEVDVIALPTCPIVAPKVTKEPTSDHEALQADLSSRQQVAVMSRNTLPFNYTGHPAVALPCGKVSGGLPTSIQLVGRQLEDALLLQIAYAFEKSVDWEHLITPPLQVGG